MLLYTPPAIHETKSVVVAGFPYQLHNTIYMHKYKLGV